MEGTKNSTIGTEPNRNIPNPHEIYLEDVGEVDLVFDVLGGDIAKRCAGLIRAGGTLVTITDQGAARERADYRLRRRTRSRPIE